MLTAKVTIAEVLPNSLVTAWRASIHKWRKPDTKWCKNAQISASATSFHIKPGKPSMPTLNAALNLAKEISDDSEVSNIQIMKGISKDMMAPLMRCKMDTMPARGKRYVGRSLKA